MIFEIRLYISQPLGFKGQYFIHMIHKALIISVMSYACLAWEFAAENHLLKIQRLQKQGFRTIGSFPRRTSIRDMHIAFEIPYVYDYITKSYRQQEEAIQNHGNENGTRRIPRQEIQEA
jgi:hypothetical protein